MEKRVPDAGMPLEVVVAHGRATLEQQRAERTLLRILLLLGEIHGQLTETPPDDAFVSLARNPWTECLKWMLTDRGEVSSLAQRLLSPIEPSDVTFLQRMRDWLLGTSLLEAEADFGGFRAAAAWVERFEQCAGYFSVTDKHLKQGLDKLSVHIWGDSAAANRHIDGLWSNFRDFKVAIDRGLNDDRIGTNFNRATSIGFAELAEHQGDLHLATALYKNIIDDSEYTTDQSRAFALYSLGRIARFQDDDQQARSHFAEALTAFERSGNQRGAEFSTLALAASARATGDHLQSIALLSRLVDNDAGEPLGTYAQLELARSFQVIGKFSEARLAYSQALLRAEVADSKLTVGEVFEGLASLNQMESDLVAAHMHYDHALAIYEKMQDLRGIARATLALGQNARARGAFDDGKALYHKALVSFDRLGDPKGVNLALQGLALLDEQAPPVDSNGGIEVTQQIVPLAMSEQEEVLKRYPEWVAAQQATEVVQVLLRVSFGENLDGLAEFFMESYPRHIRAKLVHVVVNESKSSELMAVALFPSGHVRTAGYVDIVDESEAELKPFDYWSLLDPDETGDSTQRTMDIEVFMVGIGVEL